MATLSSTLNQKAASDNPGKAVAANSQSGPSEQPAGVPFFRPAIGEEEIAAVTDVLRSGWLTTGPNNREFEERFAEVIGGDVEAVAVSSATAGLHLAAEACGLGPGDEVLVPTMTFTATAAVLRYLGAEPVLVDVDEHTRIIDLEDAARRMTARTKAIMPVHFGGLPADMPAIIAFAERHSLQVIEDAAHALPARCQGRMIGSWPTRACVFSFYANKTITTGEGGMVVTRDAEVAARVRMMRSHGLSRNAFDRFSKVSASWIYDIVAPGFKYNLTDMAAAIGIQQLAKAEKLRAGRERAALRYYEKLQGLPLDCPARAAPGDVHSWHLFPIRLHETAPMSRDEVITFLNKRNIGTSVHYRPLHQMTYWKEHGGFEGNEFPHAERYFNGAISLPLFPDMTDMEVDRVAEVLRQALT